MRLHKSYTLVNKNYKPMQKGCWPIISPLTQNKMRSPRRWKNGLHLKTSCDLFFGLNFTSPLAKVGFGHFADNT